MQAMDPVEGDLGMRQSGRSSVVRFGLFEADLQSGELSRQGDGKSLWVNASSAAGTPTLLNVKLSGKVTPSLEETEMQLGWAIPSPDGRHVAFWRSEQSSNVWLLEGF